MSESVTEKTPVSAADDTSMVGRALFRVFVPCDYDPDPIGDKVPPGTAILAFRSVFLASEEVASQVQASTVLAGRSSRRDLHQRGRGRSQIGQNRSQKRFLAPAQRSHLPTHIAMQVVICERLTQRLKTIKNGV